MAQGPTLRFIKMKAGGNAIMILPATSFVNFLNFGQELGQEMAALDPVVKAEEGVNDDFIKGYLSAVSFMQNMFIEQLNKAMVNVEIAEITPGSVGKVDPEAI